MKNSDYAIIALENASEELQNDPELLKVENLDIPF